MELINVDSMFLEHYNKKSNKSIKSLGLKKYISEYGVTIFIPLTSYKIKHESINKHDSKYHILIDNHGEPKAVLKISEYFIVGKYSNKLDVKINSIEQAEIQIIKDNEYVILRKLNDILKSNHKKIKHEINIYQCYEKKHLDATKKFSQNYVKEILYSVTLFENLMVTPQNIEEIINLSETKIEISGHDNRLLSSAIDAWNWVLDTLDESIDLEYIIGLNKRVAKYQALKVGQLRDGEGGFVHGSMFNPPIPEENEVNKKLNEFFKNANKLKGALEYFVYATKYQLFYDGNKRTSYLIVNKILIENGIGIFYISDEHKMKFNELLNNHYNESHNNILHKDKLLEFIIDNCIVYQ